MNQEKKPNKKEIVQKQILEDVKFVVAPKFDNNIDKLIANYPDGVPVKVICTALQMNKTEFEELLGIVHNMIKNKIKALSDDYDE